MRLIRVVTGNAYHIIELSRRMGAIQCGCLIWIAKCVCDYVFGFRSTSVGGRGFFGFACHESCEGEWK